MLTNDKPSLNNLVSISSAGLKVATFAEIKQALIDQYKFIYGVDIDVADTTADGVYINTNATIINNILQAMQIMYSNLDINTASGEFLDVLCRLSNIFRKPATRSNALVQVTFFGTVTTTFTPEQLTFVDKAGIEWSSIENYTFNPNEEKFVYIECKKEGPIFAPADWINNLVDAALPLSVYLSDAANVGLAEESDFSLRTRQISSGSGAGTSTLSSLRSALLSLQAIQDVLILNNFEDDPIVVDDGSTIEPHSVYIILRYIPGVTLTDEDVGRVIYDKLPIGIGTSLPSPGDFTTVHTYNNILTIAGLESTILDNQIVRWKEAVPVPASGGTPSMPTFSVYADVYPTFSTSELSSVADYLIDYFNNLPLGSFPSDTELLLKVVASDPKFKGSATFSPYAISLNYHLNCLTYFNFGQCQIKYEFAWVDQDHTKIQFWLR